MSLHIELRAYLHKIFSESTEVQQPTMQCHPWANLMHLVQASCLLNIASTYFLSWKCLQLSYMYPVNVAFLVYLTFRTKQSWFSSFLFNKTNYKKHSSKQPHMSSSQVQKLCCYKRSVYSHVHCYLCHGNLFSTENDLSMYIKDISVVWMFYPLRIFITTKMQLLQLAFEY